MPGRVGSAAQRRAALLHASQLSPTAVLWRRRLQLHMGEFNGIPATGRPVTMAGFGLLRLQDGRIAELWHLEDDLAALRQLGIIRSPG